MKPFHFTCFVHGEETARISLSRNKSEHMRSYVKTKDRAYKIILEESDSQA